MARASKTGTAPHEGRARRAARSRASVRQAEPEHEAASEAVEAAQPAEVGLPGVAAPAIEAPAVEVPAVEIPGLEGSGGEPAAAAMPPVANLPPEIAAPEAPTATAEPAQPFGEPAAAPVEAADLAPARREIPDLHGITLRFWQAQLERTVATGQAIMLCRSPQAAARLQIGYVQASLASGLAHAGEVARLSRSMARDMLPSRPR